MTSEYWVWIRDGFGPFSKRIETPTLRRDDNVLWVSTVNGEFAVPMTNVLGWTARWREPQQGGLPWEDMQP